MPSFEADVVVGEWTVVPSRNLLVRGDEQVHVERRVMDVLMLLAEHHGSCVSTEDLIKQVWQRQYGSHDVLTVTIYALRKALGDDARSPRYIETVSRRGYRLIAPVQHVPVASPERPRFRGSAWPTVAVTAPLVLVVAAAIWTVTLARPRHHVPPAEAHEAYLKGRCLLDQRSIRGWRQALEQFERAVALDPEDPAARAGLADTYTAMSDFGIASPDEMRPRAMRAAQRAMELDSRSAAALAALGRAQFLFDWNFAAAERNLARAVALDPDYMPAHQAMAWLKSAQGRYADAIAAAHRALQLDPVNTARYTELAWVMALGGHYGEALGQIDRALQLNPRSFEAYLMKGWVSELTGQPDTAFAAYRDGLRLSGVPEEALQRIEGTYRVDGLAGYYRRWLDRRGGGPPMSETWRAQLYMRIGEREQAIASLERAYQRREGALAWIRVEPSFATLRSDVRFQQIAARVGRQN